MDNYDYSTAGFDGFLSRSIDSLAQVNLTSPGPVSTQMRYDSAQPSGFLGGTVQVGNVKINLTNIIINDGQNDRLILGEADGGF